MWPDLELGAVWRWCVSWAGCAAVYCRNSGAPPIHSHSCVPLPPLVRLPISVLPLIGGRAGGPVIASGKVDWVQSVDRHVTRSVVHDHWNLKNLLAVGKVFVIKISLASPTPRKNILQ